MADSHPPKRTDSKAAERLLTQRRAENFEQHLKTLKAAIEQKKDLWATLAEFTRLNGGWVTSPPSTKTIRIEILKGSTLPVKLAHYHPRLCGTGTRITNGGFQSVDVIEISLPPGK